MSPTSVDAIADFVQKGGKVVKVRETVPVTESEVLDYLASCGFSVKYLPGDSRAYLCGRKRLSLSKLVELANGHRLAKQLPPFSSRI